MNFHRISKLIKAVLPGIIVAGLIFSANVYYDLDLGKIMVEQITRIVGMFETTATTTLAILSGNVGIGTTSPIDKLTVAGNILPSTTTQYTLGSETYKWANIFAATGTFGSTIYIGSNIIQGSATTTLFTTGNANQLVLGSNGNVGIGTTAPVTKLTVHGTDTQLRLSYSDSYYANFTVNSGGNLIISPTGGILSIDTSGVQNKLRVFSTSTDYIEITHKGTAGVLAVTAGNIEIGTIGSPVYIEEITFISASSSTSTLTVTQSGTGYAAIFMGGNVGIGTTAPVSLLELYKTDASPILTITAATSTTYSPQIAFRTGATPTTNFTLGVDISTGKLKIVPSSDITTSTGITIDSFGNVGIGTTAPSQKLHVEGQCVTGDTKLAIFEQVDSSPLTAHRIKEVQIKDVKPGQYVYSLNEKTGKIESTRINKLLDMGVKPIFKLVTDSGKEIKTTGNHPYLAIKSEILNPKSETNSKFEIPNLTQINPYHLTEEYEFSNAKVVWENKKSANDAEKETQSQSTFSVPNSPMLDMSNLDSVGANENKFNSIISTSQPEFFKISSPQLFHFGMLEWMFQLFQLINPLNNLQTKFFGNLEQFLLGPGMNFNFHGDYLARLANFFTSFQGIQDLSRSASFTLSSVSLTASGLDHSIKSTISSNNSLERNFDGAKTPRMFSSSIMVNGSDFAIQSNDSKNENKLSRAKWTKVIYLEPGDEIATVDFGCEQSAVSCEPYLSWEKIKSIEFVGYEHVYDIEVEGTHNFVANGIIAHNTYISGNVGIGTTAPVSLLELYKTDASPILTITAATSTTYSPQIAFRTGATPTTNFTLGVDISTGKLKIVPSSDITTSTGITIDSFGNVGIGTTNPLEKLDVYGNLILSGSGRYLYFGTSTIGFREDAYGNLQFRHAGSPDWITLGSQADDWSQTGNYLYPNSLSWNLGVGTSTPSSALEVKNPTSTQPILTLRSYTGTSILTVLDDGNVGIGTTSPTATLHISSTNPAGAINIVNTTTGASLLFVNATTGYVGINTQYPTSQLNVVGKTTLDQNIASSLEAPLVVNQGGTGWIAAFYKNWSEKVVIDNSGNVGIGTTNPQGKFHLYDSESGAYARIQGVGDTYNFAALQLWSDETTDKYWGLVHRKYTTELNNFAIEEFDGSTYNQRLVIKPGGNVGIGTTAPAYKLTVNGDLYVSATSTLGSATSTPVIFGGYVQSNIIPFFDNQYTLGLSNYRWANIFAATGTFGGTITIGTNTIQGSATTTLFTTGNANQLVLGANGNVGIGTTTPVAKLEVAGTLKLKPISQSEAGTCDASRVGTIYYDSTKKTIYQFQPHCLQSCLNLRQFQPLCLKSCLNLRQFQPLCLKNRLNHGFTKYHLSQN